MFKNLFKKKKPTSAEMALTACKTTYAQFDYSSAMTSGIKSIYAIHLHFDKLPDGFRPNLTIEYFDSKGELNCKVINF